jgi:hypothetical protein
MPRHIKYYHPQDATRCKPAWTHVFRPIQKYTSGGSPNIDRGDQGDLRFGETKIGQQNGAAAVEHIHHEMAQRNG